MKNVLQLAVLMGLWTTVAMGHAAEPEIKTPSPVIYLAQNLDEKDNLGWCIDTLGRGFAERLQAHSCKPRGGDVQFQFDDQTGLIRSVEFNDFCMVNRPDAKTIFGLENCNSDLPEQRFSYDSVSQEIKPSNEPESCVVVGEQSRSAGPFMSRVLLLADCEKTDLAFKQWVIVD